LKEPGKEKSGSILHLEHFSLQASKDTQEAEESDENVEEEEEEDSFMADPAAGPSEVGKSVALMKKKMTSKRKREEEELALLRSMARSLNEEPLMKVEDDHCASFGSHVITSLRQMDALHRAIAMNEIQGILTKELLDQLRQERNYTPMQTPAQNQDNFYTSSMNLLLNSHL
jgi:hypothetical protein